MPPTQMATAKTKASTTEVDLVSTSRFGQDVFFSSTQASWKNCCGLAGCAFAMDCARRCASAVMPVRAGGVGLPAGVPFLGPVGFGSGVL